MSDNYMTMNSCLFKSSKYFKMAAHLSHILQQQKATELKVLIYKSIQQIDERETESNLTEQYKKINHAKQYTPTLLQKWLETPQSF